jgi:hypothetical protein
MADERDLNDMIAEIFKDVKSTENPVVEESSLIEENPLKKNLEKLLGEEISLEDVGNMEKHYHHVENAIKSQMKVVQLEMDAPESAEYRNAVVQSAADTAMAKAMYKINGDPELSQLSDEELKANPKATALLAEAEVAGPHARVAELKKSYSMENLGEEWPHEYRQALMEKNKAQAVARVKEIAAMDANEMTPELAEEWLEMGKRVDVIDESIAKNNAGRLQGNDGLIEKGWESMDVKKQNNNVQLLYNTAEAAQAKGSFTKNQDMVMNALTSRLGEKEQGKNNKEVAQEGQEQGNGKKTTIGKRVLNVLTSPFRAAKELHRASKAAAMKAYENRRNGTGPWYDQHLPIPFNMIAGLITGLILRIPVIGPFIKQMAEELGKGRQEIQENLMKEKRPEKEQERAATVDMVTREGQAPEIAPEMAQEARAPLSVMGQEAHKEMIVEIRALNPGVNITSGADARNPNIKSDVPIEQLELPKELKYDAESGTITNKGKSIQIAAQHVEKELVSEAVVPETPRVAEMPVINEAASEVVPDIAPELERVSRTGYDFKKLMEKLEEANPEIEFGGQRFDKEDNPFPVVTAKNKETQEEVPLSELKMPKGYEFNPELGMVNRGMLKQGKIYGIGLDQLSGPEPKVDLAASIEAQEFEGVTEKKMGILGQMFQNLFARKDRGLEPLLQ